MVSTTPGAPPQHFKLEEEGVKGAGKGAGPVSTRATPQELAARGIMPPGPLGKIADVAEPLLGAPGKLANLAGSKLGLPSSVQGLLKTGTKIAGVPGKLAVGGLRKIDALLQPGGVTRAIASAPPSVRPALESVAHALETKGEAAGKAALYIGVKSVGGGPLREWLENEETPQGGASRSF
jgi:hypothetical protein